MTHYVVLIVILRSLIISRHKESSVWTLPALRHCSIASCTNWPTTGLARFRISMDLQVWCCAVCVCVCLCVHVCVRACVCVCVGFDRTRNVEIGNKNIKLNYLEEAYTSEHWLVRIYRLD